ncbi:MAG: LysR family transcriptional regulator [Oscillospiraceae bacterium]|nr:LysR family transcriptional regulator [Oscillospiraceae bacterium]
MSQSNLTKHIQYLEYQLGVDLFNHGTRPLRLTEAGKLYYRHLLREQDTERHLLEEMHEASEGLIGSLSLGAPNTLGSLLLPPALAAFYKAYPKVRIRLTEAPGASLQRLVAAGRLELAMGYAPSVASTIESRILMPGRVFIVARKSAGMLRQSPADDRLLILPLHAQQLREYRYCLFQPAQMIDAAVSAFFRAQRFTPDVYLRSATPQLNFNLVRHIDGLATFTPSYMLQALSADERRELVFFTTDAPELEWDLKAFYKSRSALSPYAQHFIRCVEELQFGKI